MFRECQFIKPGGEKCGSPALKSKPHCYFHGPERRRRSRPRKVRYFLELPFPNSRGAMLGALRGVMADIAQERIETEIAGRLIYALQLVLDARENSGIQLPKSTSRARSPNRPLISRSQSVYHYLARIL